MKITLKPLILSVLGFVFSALVAAAQPANDFFTNSIALSGTTVPAPEKKVGATGEASEPIHWTSGNPGARSVWWNWTPPVSATVQIDTFGSAFDTVLAVYTGNVISNLTRIANNDDANGVNQSRIITNLLAGTNYKIVVACFGNACTGN